MKNFCAYLSALDLLKRSRWLELINCQKTRENENTIKVLNGDHSKISLAINEIRNFATNHEIQLE